MNTMISSNDGSKEKSQSSDLPSPPKPNCHFVCPPLDLSFKCLLTAGEIKEETEFHKQPNLHKSSKTNKFLCNAIRLNNNSINDLNGFDVMLHEIIEKAENIEWIDFSFNELISIDDSLLSFKNLKVLYLHGNSIEKIQDVQKLAVLPNLKNLTLHGNHIEGAKGYRQYVLSILPGLKSLDFSAVTKQDLSTAQIWKSMNTAPKKQRKDSNAEDI